MRLSNDTFCAASIARSLVSRNISCRYWDASLRFGFEVSRWLAVVMSGAVAFQIRRVNKFDYYSKLIHWLKMNGETGKGLRRQRDDFVTL